MAIVIPLIAAPQALDAMLADAHTWAHLYTNDITPDQDTTLADLTEASWPDYAPLRISGWTPSVVSGIYAVSTADQVLWTRGTGGDPAQVFGYWVSDLKTGAMLWVERRPQGPLPMAAASDQVLLLPRVTLRQDPVPG